MPESPSVTTAILPSIFKSIAFLAEANRNGRPTSFSTMSGAEITAKLA